MATTVQNIVTRHTSTGAKKVQKDTESIGKAQTRLGQASASAGRQFSAQATGLGGIVSAYAGAAANIFAITAAFFALRKAAEFTQIVAGTQALASAIGASADELIADVQSITKSQLSLLDTVQQVNLGLVSGFDSSQITELSDVSLRASKALGRNLADAFQRVVRGAAKLEPELLDELGIFTRIDPAVRKYADSVGRSVTSLTNFERRQAFVNEVIDEGQRKYRDVDTSSRSAAVSLQALAAAITDIGLKFGGALAEGIAPFADFISGNASNAIALFGVLARVVGAQAVSVFSKGIESAAASIERFGQSAALSLDRVSAGYRTAVQAAINYSTTASRVTNLGTQQERALKQEAVALLQKNAALDTLTRAQIKHTIATLESAIAAETAFKARTKSEASANRATASIDRLTASLKKYQAAQQSGIAGTALFAGALGKISGGIALIGRGIAGVINIILRFTVFLSIAQLALDTLAKVFGFKEVKLLETIGDQFRKLLEFFKSNTKAVNSFAGSFREVKDLFKDTGLTLAESNKVFEATQKGFERFFNSLDKSQAQIAAIAEQTEKSLQNTFDDPLQTSLLLEAFDLLVSRTLELKAALDLTGKDLKNFVEFLPQLEKISGVAGSKLVNILTTSSQKLPETLQFSVDKLGQIFVTIGKIETQLTKSNGTVVRINSEFKKVAQVALGFANKLLTFNADFAEGILTAEKAASSIKALENEIGRLIAEKVKQEKLGNEVAADNLAKQVKELQIQKSIAGIKAIQLINLEKENKLLDKVFGKPQEKLDRQRFTGEINGQGGIAATQGEKQLNQARLLTSLVARQAALYAESGGTQQTLYNLRELSLKRLREITKEEQALGLTEEKRRALAKERVEKEGLVEKFGERINKANSAGVEILKASENATKNLLLLRDQILIKAQQEVDKLNIKKIQQEQKLFEINQKINTTLERRQLVVQKAITAELIAQGQAQTKFLKDIGGLTAQEDISRTEAINTLKISVAQADKDFADKQAAIQRDIAVKRLESENKSREIQAKTSLANVRAMIGVIRSLDNLSNAINKEAIKQGRKNVSNNSKALSDLVGENTFRTGRVTEGTLDGLVRQTEENNKKILGANKNLAEQDFRLKIDSNSMTFKALKASLAREQALKEQSAELSVRLFKGVNTAVRGNLSKGINDLFDAIANGTLTLKNFREGFNQFLFNIVNDIRKQLLKETLTDPLSDMATGALKGLFNIKGNTSAIGAASTSAFNSGVNLPAYSGAPNFDAFFASGGRVKHLAAGGMQRDRVPALLEPGEFVMKRSAARSIGESNLNAMNATGSAGNVSVNIINQGTPQESTQSSQPRFDGEKFVIDIVTRDLRNNGPIRKSLRGGS